MNHGGVAEYADLGLRTVLVTQADGVGHDFSKVRMGGRFAVTGKGQHVGQLAVGLHLEQCLFQFLSYLLTGRPWQGGDVIMVETAFTVDAVEGA